MEAEGAVNTTLSVPGAAAAPEPPVKREGAGAVEELALGVFAMRREEAEPNCELHANALLLLTGPPPAAPVSTSLPSAPPAPPRWFFLYLCCRA